MSKVVCTVWISALSGLAFLAACCSANGLTRKERKQIARERDSIQTILDMHEMAAVYGSPEVIASFKAETYRLRHEVDSLNNLLGKNVDMEKSTLLYRLQTRLAELKASLQYIEGAKVYGPPEIIKKHEDEADRLREEAQSVEKQIEELEKQ